jgi:hypothetical protein
MMASTDVPPKETTMARKTNILWLGAVATTLALSTQAQAACNIRGEHCGRPAWAANALSGRFDRVPDSALENPPRTAPHYSKPQPQRIERAVKHVVPERVVRTVAPLVKFADGEGRQFDTESKVWFDGESRCWSGSKQFTFKDGDWFYGKKEWVESKGSWKVTSGEAPELVSCESVSSFAAKAKAFAAKTAPKVKLESAETADKGATSQPSPATPAPAQAKIKTAEGDTSAVAQKPVTTPASAECKKYFPSVGQMIAVPCTE